MEVNDEKAISWIEVKKILMKKEKEKELGYEQKNALEHLRKFCKIPESKAEKIVEELKKIEKLKDKHIVNILNFLPENLDDVRILFANERVVLTDEDKKKILKTVKDNR
ncbi:MAG: RNA polymerase [Candidatus Aenigmarchaeota archaeon]|nr:RNA polymerase [Candidatus Aenigmarchaeota archaeon]NIP39904.1 RNA polymerase [Candidatus Aenigmarchaeota archaeon]NIQ17623.1 RNA polymerase [Candidatus Aenigmarchaeota archaeon]NIS72811.1 RNA polymerase [Candidatus Aenigmarchaeota archaeon]